MELSELHWFWTGFLYCVYIVNIAIFLFLFSDTLRCSLKSGAFWIDCPILFFHFPLYCLVTIPSMFTAFIKWVATDYFSFWHGLIDLILSFLLFASLIVSHDWYTEIMGNIIKTTMAFFSSG